VGPDAQFWLDLARGDLRVTRALLESAEPLYVGFFCHLAVEKALKAWCLERTGKSPPRSHDLEVLAAVAGLRDPMPERLRLLLKQLMPFAVEVRYPASAAHLAAFRDGRVARDMLEETEAVWSWFETPKS
jgi:HEPN domain-containing protein